MGIDGVFLFFFVAFYVGVCGCGCVMVIEVYGFSHGCCCIAVICPLLTTV